MFTTSCLYYITEDLNHRRGLEKARICHVTVVVFSPMKGVWCHYSSGWQHCSNNGTSDLSDVASQPLRGQKKIKLSVSSQPSLHWGVNQQPLATSTQLEQP